MKSPISLAACTAWITAGVVGAAMLVYAVFQYFTTPDIAFSTLLLRHGWHVIVLSGLTYLVLNVLLYRQVVRPIQDLYVKLYAIPRGDRRPIRVASRIREIQQVAESINMLLDELRPAASANRPQRIAVRTAGSGGETEKRSDATP